MTVVSVVPDRDAQTLTLTAEYRAAVDQVWQLWADPRLLERWWGPPTYPATVVDHDLAVGGSVTYFMTSPEGERFHGWWRVTGVDAPQTLEFDDGFGESEASAPADLPVTSTRVTVVDAGGGVTRMVITSSFPSTEAMDQVLAMGAAEGLTGSVGQTDALLPAPATGPATGGS